MQHDYDILIIGTGMGGGTLAYALRNSGYVRQEIACDDGSWRDHTARLSPATTTGKEKDHDKNL